MKLSEKLVVAILSVAVIISALNSFFDRRTVVQAAPPTAAANVNVVNTPLAVTSTDATLNNPSDSIVAFSYLGAACYSAGGSTINSKIGPDGSILPFSIPAGSAFMVTGVDFSTENVPAGGRAGFLLRIVGSGFVIAQGYAINTGAAGPVAGTARLTTPMRVTGQLCIDPTIGSVSGGTQHAVRGYLVKDQ
jgi:hypothetical protein